MLGAFIAFASGRSGGRIVHPAQVLAQPLQDGDELDALGARDPAPVPGAELLRHPVDRLDHVAPGVGDGDELEAAILSSAPAFDEASTEAVLRATAEARGIKAGPLIHATRIAVTGKAVSPGLFDVLALVGRDEVVLRLRALEQFLRGRS